MNPFTIAAGILLAVTLFCFGMAVLHSIRLLVMLCLRPKR
jgi:hypothetical protein